MTANTDIDIALIRGDDGLYDIRVAENGDLEGVRNFDTAIILSLFTDRRASSSEVAKAANRRGWMGNEILFGNDFEYGSKLWLYEQSRLTESIVIEFEDAARNALQWIIDNQHATNINVNGRLLTDDRSGILLNITFFITPDVVETRQFIFWENTGNFDG